MGFGQRLADARKAKGLSQEALGRALAEAMGEPSGDASKKQAISHWEKDRYQPNILQLEKLCDILDCTADQLILGRTPESLPADAIEQARFYNRLSPGGKKKWRALRPVFADPLPDKDVERRIPATTQPKE